MSLPHVLMMSQSPCCALPLFCQDNKQVHAMSSDEYSHIINAFDQHL